MNLSLRVSVRHDCHRGAALLSSLPPRLDAAMRRGTERSTELVREATVDLVEARTNMGPEAARRIVEAKMLPGAGSVSHGRVSMTKPPARFYPRTKKALAFTIDGRKVVVKSVRGSRPYKLIGRAAGASSTDAARREIYEEEIREVMGS